MTPNQVYGEGDELTIAFDRATDEAFESTHARSGDETFVNGLFEFSHVLGNPISPRYLPYISLYLPCISHGLFECSHVLGNRLSANPNPNPSPSPNPNCVPHLTQNPHPNPRQPLLRRVGGREQLRGHRDQCHRRDGHSA